jgi:hypothetical protein
MKIFNPQSKRDLVVSSLVLGFISCLLFALISLITSAIFLSPSPQIQCNNCQILPQNGSGYSEKIGFPFSYTALISTVNVQDPFGQPYPLNFTTLFIRPFGQFITTMVFWEDTLFWILAVFVILSLVRYFRNKKVLVKTN